MTIASRLIYVQSLHSMLLFSRHEYVMFAPLILGDAAAEAAKNVTDNAFAKFVHAG